MFDWNTVATVQQGRFHQAIRFLERFGEVGRTDYLNVLVLKVGSIERLLEDLLSEISPQILQQVIGHIMPAAVTFDFQTPQEFEARLKQAMEPWMERLAGSRFHVRMHRRGFKGRLSSQDEERFLDEYLLSRLAREGASAYMDFADADFIIALETVGQRCGASLWSREQRLRYPFLKLD